MLFQLVRVRKGSPFLAESAATERLRELDELHGLGQEWLYQYFVAIAIEAWGWLGQLFRRGFIGRTSQVRPVADHVNLLQVMGALNDSYCARVGPRSYMAFHEGREESMKMCLICILSATNPQTSTNRVAKAGASSLQLLDSKAALAKQVIVGDSSHALDSGMPAGKQAIAGRVTCFMDVSNGGLSMLERQCV